MDCVFGDWDCPVADRLVEMQRELVATIKIKPPAQKKETQFQIPFDDLDKGLDDYLTKMFGAFASPLVTLSGFCQACPIVKEKYSVYSNKKKEI